jgi:hypothetical protein
MQATKGTAARGKARKAGSDQPPDNKSAQGQQRRKSLKPQRDSRAHYGDMTGPEEEDLWQSDDSEKVNTV